MKEVASCREKCFVQMGPLVLGNYWDLGLVEEQEGNKEGLENSALLDGLEKAVSWDTG